MDVGPVGVAAGVGAVPVPGGLDDAAQVGVAGLPSQFALYLRRRRDRLGRIAGPARAFLDGDWFTSHLLGGADHLADAVSLADAEVVAEALARLKFLQSE